MRWTFPYGFLLIFLAGLLLSGPYGCSEQQEQAKPVVKKPVLSLRIGILPEQDVFSQKERYHFLADYVVKKSGIQLEPVIVARYGNIFEEFRSENLDGAFFGSLTGAMALMNQLVTPLVRPEWKDGTSTYFGMIFVRKDSGIRNVADMKGKRFVFVDKATTAGYLLPLHFFVEEGIKDYRAWFGETYFAGTHEDAIYDVLQKRADIGAAKNTVFYRFAETDNRLLEELEILTTSPEVPANGLAVRRDMDPRHLTKLKSCFLDMEKDPHGREVLDEFGARRFIETTVTDYRPVFDFARHIGLNLATYNFQDE